MTSTILQTTAEGLVRPPAVAGSFYPDQADQLALLIDADLRLASAHGRPPAPGDAPPKAIIVPHAGYVYSGPIAARAFALLAPWRDVISRVVLLGPAHRVWVASMALSSADRWVTPLGAVALDTEGREQLRAVAGVVIDDGAHAPEHSLEVEVPFLQRVLGSFTLLPVVVGPADAAAVAAALDVVWGGAETVIVVSSDLSHYHDADTAQQLDLRTAGHILAEDGPAIGPSDACGAFPLRGLLAAARARAMSIELLDLRHSGDTAGSRDRVVGYGAFVLHSPSAPPSTPDAPTPDDPADDPDPLTAEDRRRLLAVATEAIRAELEDRSAAPVEGTDTGRFTESAATFVTLRDGERLIGCIGSIEPTRTLAEDVAHNAVAAAFSDPRLPALTADEFPRMSVHVSVLTEPVPLTVSSWAELVTALRPHEDGVLIHAGRHRATFLPSVWEQIPDPEQFLTHLWNKARLRPRRWPSDLEVWRYRTIEFGDDGPRPAIAADPAPS